MEKIEDHNLIEALQCAISETKGQWSDGIQGDNLLFENDFSHFKQILEKIGYIFIGYEKKPPPGGYDFEKSINYPIFKISLRDKKGQMLIVKIWDNNENSPKIELFKL